MGITRDAFRTRLRDTRVAFASHCRPVHLNQSSFFHPHHRCFLSQTIPSPHHLGFPIVIQLQSPLGYPLRSHLLQTNH
jgi:hypothetical protein